MDPQQESRPFPLVHSTLTVLEIQISEDQWVWLYLMAPDGVVYQLLLYAAVAPVY